MFLFCKHKSSAAFLKTFASTPIEKWKNKKPINIFESNLFKPHQGQNIQDGKCVIFDKFFSIETNICLHVKQHMLGAKEKAASPVNDGNQL